MRENTNDLSIKNVATGHNSYYAPDNDPSLHTHSIRPVDDPLSTPSNGQPIPSDILLYQQNLQFGASPLVQAPQYAAEPYHSYASQPQLQQYHLQQNTMMKQGMFPSLNPTYLVMQSNNLLGQHQQHLTSQLFRPEHGYIDTQAHSVTAQPFNSFDYTQPQQVASLGQIYSSQQDQFHQDAVSSTQSPTTLAAFHHDAAASQDNPTYTQVLEPKPSNYQYSHQNFIDLPDEHLSQNDVQNLLYNDLYQDYVSNRQLENDLILREAQQELQEKQNIVKQQNQNAYDLHQLVQQEKFNPLRIVVPDEDQGVRTIIKQAFSFSKSSFLFQFKKHSDDEEAAYDDEYSDEQSSEEEKTESKDKKSS